MIALCCSVEVEADCLMGRMKPKKSGSIGSKTMVEGTLEGREVLLSVGGMGKVNAAHASTLLLSRYSPEALLIFGVGGAYPASGAQVGDLALAKEEIAGDEGVLTGEGFKDTEYMGIPLLKTADCLIYNVYPASKQLFDRSWQTLTRDSPAGTVHAGSFVTLSTCTGTAARARELEKRYNGLCENMEGAAAAQVATFHNVPWLEVRGISNVVEDRDIRKWDIRTAAAAAQKAVLAILRDWKC